MGWSPLQASWAACEQQNSRPQDVSVASATEERRPPLPSVLAAAEELRGAKKVPPWTQADPRQVSCRKALDRESRRPHLMGVGLSKLEST